VRGNNARRLVLATVGLVLAGATIALTAPNMQEGEWETAVEVKMEVPGMPGAVPPMSFKNTQCLTQKDLVPNTAGPDQQCTILEHTVNGNTVNWKIRCVDKDGTMDGRGQMIYSGGTYQGQVQATHTPRDRSDPPMKTDMKLNGRHVGVCKR
jgi:hypothetical protein